MTTEDRLRLVNELLNSDVGYEADLVSLDRKAGERERAIAALVMRIYRLVHPHFSACSHPTWEAENEKLLSNLSTKR